VLFRIVNWRQLWVTIVGRAEPDAADPCPNTLDVLPINWSIRNWNFPLMIPQSGRGDFHEVIEVHRGADRLRSEAGRGWCGGRRGVPQGGHFGCDLLQLAQEVRRPDAFGDASFASTRRGECQAKADRRRPVSRQGDAAGRAGKKTLRPARKRELVDRVRGEWKVSIRRACSALKIDRSLYVYKSRRGEQADLKQRIREICETRVRYGYRRVHILLRRDGWTVNPKRIYRLYKELDLQLRHKTPRRRVKAKLREDRTVAVRSNETWAMDFVHDQLATGRKIRILTIVDTFSRFSPAVDPRFNYRGEDVVQALERICREVGYPKSIRVDQGSEFVSRDLDLWAYQKDVVLDFSRPGKPTDNAFIESFNGKLRAECLNTHWAHEP